MVQKIYKVVRILLYFFRRIVFVGILVSNQITLIRNYMRFLLLSNLTEIPSRERNLVIVLQEMELKRGIFEIMSPFSNIRFATL